MIIACPESLANRLGRYSASFSALCTARVDVTIDTCKVCGVKYLYPGIRSAWQPTNRSRESSQVGTD